MAITPLCQPSSIIAGDSLAFYVQNPLAPPPDWALKFVIGTPTPTITDATVAGNQFLVEIVPAVSATLDPGIYTSNSVYSNATTQERNSIYNGFFYVLPNPLVVSPTFWAKTTLAAVEAALTKLAGSTNSQIAINGQTFTKRDINALMQFRDRLKAEIGYHDAQLGLPGPGQSKTIRTRFVS